MRKRINLFRVKKQKDLQVIFFQKLQTAATIIGVFLFFIFIILMFFQVKLNREVNDLGMTKQRLLNEILNSKNITAKIKYFKGKLDQLNIYLKDDANFLPYYSLLKQAVDSSSESAVIQSIAIDKERKTEFFIKFSDYLSMINFLNYIESPGFLKYFSELSLKNFSLRGGTLTNTQKNYQLTFQGKFKEINEQND